MIRWLTVVFVMLLVGIVLVVDQGMRCEREHLRGRTRVLAFVWSV